MLLAGPDDELWSCALVDGEVRRLDAAQIVDVTGGPFDDWNVLGSHRSHLYLYDYGDGYHGIDVTMRVRR